MGFSRALALSARAALCVLLAASAWLQGARACNSLILDDSVCGGGIVSGATFSETWALESNVVAAPPGAKRPLLSITDDPRASTFGASFSTKYGYVCIGHDMQSVARIFGAKGSVVPPGWLLCSQGMNTKGLAVALQAQHGNTGIAFFDAKSNKKQALNYWDLTAWLLSHFDSVKAVKQALNDVQVVVTPKLEQFAGGAPGTSQWIGVYDASGAAIVIQFRNKTLEVVDNPLGVFSNNPGYLQDHMKKYHEWAKAAGYTLDAQGLFIAGPVGSGPADKPKAQRTRYLLEKVPGGYNGDDRFVRMAALKGAALLKRSGLNGCWPPAVRSKVTPAFVPEGYPSQNPTMLAVLAILDTVKLPRGVTDGGALAAAFPQPTDWFNDATLWLTLRDHTNKVFYFQTSNSYAWRAVDLAKMDWARLGGRLAHTPLAPPKESGVLDVTNTLLAAAGH